MKRLSIALAAVGISVSALAALPAATDPTLVAVPQLPGGFFIGGQAYYLQPSPTDSDLDYANLRLTGLQSNAGTTRIETHSVRPDYNWGWGINVGYIFPGTGNDIEATYFNLDTSDTDSFGTALGRLPGDTFLASVEVPVSNPALGTSFVSIAQLGGVEAKADYTFNRVDLTLGQYLDVGCRLVLHPKLGLTWAQVERQLSILTTAAGQGTVEVAGGTTASPFTFSNVVHTSVNSKYDGIGPLFGIDASYYIGSGFGLVGHADAVLLVGDIKDVNYAALLTRTGTVNGQPGIIFNNHDSIHPSPRVGVETRDVLDDARRIVPVLDGKLGLDYTFVFNNTANSDMTLEAGWQVSNYFNAVDNVMTGIRKTSDVGLNGPYVSLVFHM